MSVFTANFTVTQAATGATATVTDTSGGVTSNFTSRTLNIYDIYGNDLGPGNWPFTAGNTYQFNITPWDQSLRIVLTYTPIVVVPGDTYTKTAIATLTVNSYLFGVYIGQLVAANPGLLEQVNFVNSMAEFWTNLKNAINMGSYSQQQSAQSFLDAIYYMYQNKQTIFG